MKKLFFDIETIPCDDEVREIFVAMQKKRSQKREEAEEDFNLRIEDLILKTTFDGTFGRVCCIGTIKEDGKITKKVLQGNEKEMLTSFWKIAADVDLFVGHNIFDFDFPFLYKRSIINGIKPKQINLAHYRSNPVYDTMWEWEKWGREAKSGLDTLAHIFGFPTSKDEMDGSEVWGYYQKGKIDDISKYCMKDVELVRKVYYKMIFEEMPQGEQQTLEDIPF